MSGQRAIGLDLTRLMIGPAWSTPRGIDRVDLAYANHFLNKWGGDCLGVVATLWGGQIVDREQALASVVALEEIWGEHSIVGDDPAYDQVSQFLGAETTDLPPATSPSDTGRISRVVRHVFRRIGLPIGRSARRKLPSGSLYLNTGQIGIADRRLISWLEKRPDVRPVFMLHDTIPLDFPEHVPEASRQFHQKMIDNTARFAQGMIVTTKAAGTDISRELVQSGRQHIPVVAAPLPPAKPFVEDGPLMATQSRDQYFVICGAIEPRKNHLLLLNIWRELARELGEKTPKLVIVGRRWNIGSETQFLLDRSPFMKRFVVEVEGLTTPSLVRLVAGAQALLMPSFAEGFGLPVVEALSLGTPVIASDIPAHREAGGDRAHYLSPIDGVGWKKEIRSILADSSRLRSAAARFAPFTWDEYFQTIEQFLSGIDRDEDAMAGARSKQCNQMLSEKEAAE